MAKKSSANKKKAQAQTKPPISKQTPRKSTAKSQQLQQLHKEEKEESDVASLIFLGPSFHKQLQDFKQIYKDFLILKHTESKQNIQKQLSEVSDRVTRKIQIQALQIFKEKSQQIQKWIEQQLHKKEDEVKSIQSVYQINRDSLRSTGAFSQEEIKKQLSPIQDKVQAKKEEKEKFEQLLSKNKQIYA